MKKNREPNNTIEDVARHAGVSIKTVSRVLNSEPNVRQTTREKVLATAQSMGYAPNISARRLAARRSFIVALVYRDDDVNHYIPDIQHGALDVCRERGYNLLLHPCQGSVDDAAHEIEQLARQSLLDGFILVPPLADARKLLGQIARQDVPFVRVSQLHRGELSPSVSVGDRAGAYKMAEYLAGLKHRDVAFIVGNENQGASIDRLRGYREAVADFGLRDKPEWVRQGDFTFESGVRCMEELLTLRKRPDRRVREQRRHGGRRVAGRASPRLCGAGRDQHRRLRRHLDGATAVAATHDRAPADQEGGRDRDRHAARQPAHAGLHAVNQEIPGELVVRESAARAGPEMMPCKKAAEGCYADRVDSAVIFGLRSDNAVIRGPDSGDGRYAELYRNELPLGGSHEDSGFGPRRLGPVLTPHPSHAQAPAKSASLDEIVVTATRRETTCRTRRSRSRRSTR